MRGRAATRMPAEFSSWSQVPLAEQQAAWNQRKKSFSQTSVDTKTAWGYVVLIKDGCLATRSHLAACLWISPLLLLAV